MSDGWDEFKGKNPPNIIDNNGYKSTTKNPPNLIEIYR
jgi:hypothetical protein